MVAIQPKSTERRPGRRFAAVIALTALLWLAGSALAGMSVIDDDTLSDVEAATGLSMVLHLQTTAGEIDMNSTYNGTSTFVDFQGVTINNSGTGFANIGDTDDPVKVDVGTGGGTSYLQFQFPNGMSTTDNQHNEVPSIQASTVNWSNSAGVAVNIGSLSINQIYQNDSIMRFSTLGDGLGLLAELNADITSIYLTKGTTQANAGYPNSSGAHLNLQDMYFCNAIGGTYSSPSRGTGYFSFGSAASPMTIQIGTNGTLTTMQLNYVVSGSVVLRNAETGKDAAGNYHDYGPLVMAGISGGNITITMPLSTSTGQVWFAPDF
jgi:hypothetical protein